MTPAISRTSAETTLRRAAAFLRIVKADAAEPADADEPQLILPVGADPAIALVEKTIWGSPAGKKKLAPRLVKLIPPHKTYVEPFAGSGAVFFAKEPVAKEVLSDADPDIAFAYKALSKLSDGELAALKKKDWTGRKSLFQAMKEAKPKTKVEKLYQFLYLSHFAYGKLRGKSFNPNAEGIAAHTIKRIEKFRDRLRNVTVRSGHYADVVKEFDGKDTFFFLDPPYPGYNVSVGEDKFDEQEFRKILDGIKGKFLITYGVRGKLDTSGFEVRTIRTPRTISAMRGVGGPKMLSQLLIANYGITQKSLGPFELEPIEAAIDLTRDTAADLDHARVLAKALADEARQPAIVALAQELERIEGGRDERAVALAGELAPVIDRLLPSITTSLPATAAALSEAAPVVDGIAAIESWIEKARRIPFQQWGGSAMYARKMADKLPAHKRYVEPFCGAAAVFYAKAKAPEEVLGDADPEVAFAHRFLQKLDDRTMAALARLPWKVSRAGFAKAQSCKPSSDAERFWKLAYGRLCTWGAKPSLQGYASVHHGLTYKIDELWKFHERLKGVRILHQDWKKTIADHDGKATLFFIDPPYEREWTMGDGIPPAEIAAVVRKLKGQFVVAYTDSAAARRAFADVGRAFKLRIPETHTGGHWRKRSRLFIASPGVQKADVRDAEADRAQRGAQAAELAIALTKRIPILKTGEERYVLGIVLEPETVDAQSDIYSAETVRAAAHKFMTDFQHVGLMHKGLIDGRVKILESYVAPAPFDLDGAKVKQGTWLLALRVDDDRLWTQVKNGELTGLSMGGTALSAPESDSDSQDTA